MRVIDPVGRVTQLNYFGERIKEIVDPAGRKTLFKHDAQGNLTQITDPDQSARTFEYSQDTHRIVSKTSKRGFETQLTYSESGRIVSATLPDNSKRRLLPRDMQALPDMREGDGSETAPAQAPIALSNARGVVTDANGNITTRWFDENSYVREVVDGVGRRTLMERDIDGNVTTLTRPNESIVRNTYDDNGNVLTSLEEFNGALTTYTYDSFSLVTSMVDALDRRTEMERDARGNLIRSENAEGHVSTMEYNSRGQVTRMVDPNGLVTQYDYDQHFLVVRKTETPPVGNVRITSTQYNDIGLPVSVTTPDGITQTFEYDALNRPTRVQNQLGEAQTTVYDEYGNVIELSVLNTDGRVATQETREYDERDRLITITRP